MQRLKMLDDLAVRLRDGFLQRGLSYIADDPMQVV